MSSSIDLSQVAAEGLGLMNFTWRPEPVSKETAFGVMQEAIKINLPKKTFFNGGEFYGANNINLEYIRDFFAQYPELRQHVIVSIKGAIGANLIPNPTTEGIANSIDNIIKYIPDLDIFEPARLSKQVPFEETAAALDSAIDAGKIKAYTLSECSGDSLEQFAKIAKHKPVGAEVEFSLFTREIADNGVAKVAGELDVPIIAYSPLSRGFLSGEIKTKSDIPEGDMRHHLGRFSEENIKKNRVVVEELAKIAEKRGVTSAQLALAWLKYHSGKTINGIKYPKIIPIPSSSSIGRVQENFAKVTLSDEEFSTIQTLLDGNAVHGHRYTPQVDAFLSV
ncbi:putative pyridoxal reductase [Cyberlindnera fabianii]|uniref:Putative pyridoxal reductase n=1 Tax=Cyberlindnera fabianii TaxID=36022 RepID=A0A1V2LDC5_CYBFA|nr:putative pyridoxal reductase [Cyberlindnera fabianii]